MCHLGETNPDYRYQTQIQSPSKGIGLTDIHGKPDCSNRKHNRGYSYKAIQNRQHHNV